MIPALSTQTTYFKLTGAHRKVQHDGFVETPRIRTTRRKSVVREDDDESSSAAETTRRARTPSRTRRSRTPVAADASTSALDNDKSYAGVLKEAIGETSNGHSNSNGNGSAPKKKKELSKEDKIESIRQGKVIDGWIEGLDPKVDYSGKMEFGGSFGVSAIMVGFTLVMYYMWLGATYYDGKLPLPASGQSIADFLRQCGHQIYEGAFPHLRAWTIYWTFFVVEGAFYCLMPGVWAYGKPLPHMGGKQLPYYCSGVWSFYATIVLAATLHFTGIFPLYTILDEFGPLMSVAMISGYLVALVAYFSALWRGAQHRMTGYPVYDFFMGAELNPRMFGILDFKMFFEVRLPWYILFALSCAAAARQWEQLGYVSGEVGFLVMAHFLYVNACSKGEELIVTTWDMYYEKWGFMLIFWNLAGVPLSYCHCTIYLANHHPSVYRWNRAALTALYISYLFVYWVWDTTNSQKNRFRAEERGTLVLRKTFPQLPWQTVKNPRKITTKTGDSILVDGWYGYARKIHYTCDLFFALSWGAITGFESPFPWFYPLFFACMIAHRAYRDIERCREKYGADWEEYTRRVPYLFIPVSRS